MRKLSFILMILFGSILSCSAQAQRYVRKHIKPNFFIPADETVKKEVLPEIKYSNPIMNEGGDDKYEYESFDPEFDDYDMDNPITSEYRAPSFQEPEEPSETGPYKPQQDPLYQYKYDEYISDLRIIGERGSAPVNATLEKDLAKMNSNQRFVVDEQFGSRPASIKTTVRRQ